MRQPFYGKNLHQSSNVNIYLNFIGILYIVSLLTIVVNLYSHKDGDVLNLWKFEYFYDYFRH